MMLQYLYIFRDIDVAALDSADKIALQRNRELWLLPLSQEVSLPSPISSTSLFRSGAKRRPRTLQTRSVLKLASAPILLSRTLQCISSPRIYHQEMIFHQVPHCWVLNKALLGGCYRAFRSAGTSSYGGGRGPDNT